MGRIRFSGEAAIEIQGGKAIRQTSLDQDTIEYEVIGLESSVKIIDNRPVVNDAFHRLLANKQLGHFAAYFNTPAYVIVSEEDSGVLLVELSDTAATLPVHRLWIAVGIGDSVPAYDYMIVRGSEIRAGEFAFFSIYARPAGFPADGAVRERVLHSLPLSS